MANLEDHPLVNLSRSSNQTYFDSNGVLQTAGNDSLPPSYEYNSATGLWEKKGWYIGEARENLIQYSEAFNNVWWGKTRVSVTSDIETAPDGTMTADKLVEDISTNNHYLQFSGITTSGNNTLSIFAKAAERHWIVLNGVSSSDDAYFDLQNGVVGTTGNNVIGASIKDVGNGWYKCSMTSSGVSGGFILMSDGDNSQSYAGDGTSGIYIWGAQLEQASFPSPYIPTSGSTVTRSATLADITDLSWYNQDEGTFVVESIFGEDNAQRYFSLNKNFSNALCIYKNSGIRGFLAINGTTTQNLGPALNVDDFFKGAISYGSEEVSFAYNGVDVGTNSYPNTPLFTPVRLNIGYNIDSSFINDYIKSLKYYPKRLSNSQLQSLTS